MSNTQSSVSQRLRIGVIFGGRSVEHEVSLVSAASVIDALDKTKYDVVPIGISHTGQWLSSGQALRMLKEHLSLESEPERLLVPDPRKQSLVNIHQSGSSNEKLDVIIPVVHGTFSEDGSLQGLLELANIPYVGAGVLGSAVGMDKVVQKELLRQAKIPVTPSESFLFSEYKTSRKKIVARVVKRLK